MPVIPSVLPPDATVGETRLFRLFEKLPSSFVTWINPRLGDRVTPDFVLYSPKSGLVVMEVKDWTLGQVVAADRQTVQFRNGWEESIRTCPLGQVEAYFNVLKSMFRRPGEHGFILPLACGTAFPHICRAEYEARLHKDPYIAELTCPATTLFQDDLEALERSPDKGKAWQEWLDTHIPAGFRWQHNPETLKTVQQKLGRSVVMSLPGVTGQDGKERLVELDEEQEKQALMLPGGHRLLYGPAGSGKTLVLVRYAAELFRREKGRRMLFLCFNLALAGYIRRLLSRKAIPLGPGGVEVMPVYDLASIILGDRIEARENSGYYQTVQELALSELASEGHPLVGRWDAVFVDEGQDFSLLMIRMVEKILRPGAPLLVAMDADQHIYAESSYAAWASFSGMKTVRLKKRYRSTRQIMAFAHDWLASGDFLTDGELGVQDGPMPQVMHAASAPEAADLAAGLIAGKLARGKRQGDMAILFARDRLGEGKRLSSLAAEALAARGCLTQWPSEDDRAKRRYDITTDAVVISTIHSMKGMDFSCVVLILPQSMAEGREHTLLKDMQKRREAWEARQNTENSGVSLRRSLIYVGMTRARQELAVIWYDDTEKVEK